MPCTTYCILRNLCLLAFIAFAIRAMVLFIGTDQYRAQTVKENGINSLIYL